MNRCSECHHPLADHANYCHHCGQPLAGDGRVVVVRNKTALARVLGVDNAYVSRIEANKGVTLPASNVISDDGRRLGWHGSAWDETLRQARQALGVDRRRREYRTGT